MSEKTPESKNSSIKIEEVHRKRDLETQEEMDEIRKEIERDNEERRNYNKNKEELEELKKVWSASGNLLSQEKQERLNQLEDLVYEHERKNERTSENEFLDALNEELSVMEQAGKITPEQAEEKRKEATLIETGFSKDPKYDALLFSRAGIADEEEMIKIFNKKNAETQEESEGVNKEENIPKDILEFRNLLNSDKDITEEEVKKIRRDLLFKYHHDYNSDNDAHKAVYLINEAFRAWEKGEDVDNHNESEDLLQLEGNSDNNDNREDTEESDVEQSPEKSLEEFLKEKRDEFVRMDADAVAWVKIQKKYRKDVTKETFGEEVNENYEQVKKEYFQVLNDLRLQKINALNENLSPQEREKEIEKIFKETVNLERINLHEAKLNLLLKEKPENFKERIKENTKKVVSWYRKLPLKWKLSISAGLLGVGAGAGLVGGATGVALATGAFAGIKAQRVLSGAGVAVGLEGLIKRSQEKKTEKNLMKQFAENLEEKMKSKDFELDKRILELEGKMTKERIRRYLVSGTAGVLIGSGAVATALDSVSNYFDSGSDPEKSNFINKISEKLKAIFGFSEESVVENEVESASVEPEVEVDKDEIKKEDTGVTATTFGEKAETEFIEKDHVRPVTEAGVERSFFMEPKTLTAEIKPGSSVWSTTENYLKENFGDRFSDLNEGQKTHLIDQIKDKIAQNPAEFGLEGVKDIDHVQAGQTIDFSSVVREESFKNIFEASESLSQDEIDSIVRNNEAIAEWVSQNPEQSLTTEKVNEIIKGSVSGDSIESVEEFFPEVDEEIIGTDVDEKTFEVKALSEQYRLSEEFIQEKLQIIDSSGLEGETKEALVQIYFENWNETVSPEKTDTVLNKFLGEEYLRLREFCTGSPEISRDDVGNIVMSLDNAEGVSWNKWDVIISPQDEITLKGSDGLQLDRAPLNSETLERIKETLSINTRGRF